MQERPLEHCCHCDQPTGKAGRGDGSIYIDALDLGPLCEECWHAAVEEIKSDAGISDLEAEVERLLQRIKELEDAASDDG